MNKNNNPTLSFIKKAIAAQVSRGVSVENIAAKVGMHRNSFYRYLAGKQKLNCDAFITLLNVLNVSESDLKELLEANKKAR